MYKGEGQWVLLTNITSKMMIVRGHVNPVHCFSDLRFEIQFSAILVNPCPLGSICMFCLLVCG